MRTILAALIATVSVIAEEIYEPMYSFSSPFILESGKLPYWENAGATVITEDFVRLVPAMQSKQGSPSKFQDWRVVGEFRVGGGGKIGADGFAVWYTKERAEIGPAFGSRDYWTGLGVFFDTFDNDGSRDHPAVYAIYNDGTKTYQVDKDGGSDVFGRCQSYFRNPSKEAWFEIKYENGMLSVAVDASSAGTFTPCITPTSVPLQPGYFFGISATTGGLSDNHDFFGFQVFSLGGRVDNDNPLVQAGFQLVEEGRARKAAENPPPPRDEEQERADRALEERRAQQAQDRVAQDEATRRAEEARQQAQEGRMPEPQANQNQGGPGIGQYQYNPQQPQQQQPFQNQQYQPNNQAYQGNYQNPGNYQNQQYQNQQYPPQNQQQQQQFNQAGAPAPAPAGVDLSPLENLLQAIRTDLSTRLDTLERRITNSENRLTEILNAARQPSGLTQDQLNQLNDIQTNLRVTAQTVSQRLTGETDNTLRSLQQELNRATTATTEILRQQTNIVQTTNSLKDSLLKSVEAAGGYGYLFWFTLVQVPIVVVFVFWRRQEKSKFF